MTIDLSTRYMGLALPNPFIVGSSGLTRSVEGVRRCAEAGAGAVVLKSIFEEQILADTARAVADSADSLLHAEALDYIAGYGSANAVGAYLELVAAAKRAVTIPVIASINCVTPDRWVDYARQLQDAGADGLELNLFWLPVNPRRGSAELEARYFDAVTSVRAKVRLPLALKMSYFLTGLAEVLTRLAQRDVQALVLFNRYLEPELDIERLTVGTSSYFSQPVELARPLRWIALLAREIDCDLAGSTGVHDGAGAIKLLLAGATAVQVVSTLYLHGLGRLAELRAALVDWMGRHGCSSLAQVRARLPRDAGTGETFERVQFMKLAVAAERDDL